MVDLSRDREAQLAARYTAAAAADQVLAQVLAAAHGSTVENAALLRAVAAEVDSRALSAPAVDTAMGAREFQRFLIDKQRAAIDALAGARRTAAEAKTRLESLHDRYPGR